jgi:hypothetical protein
MLGFVGVDFRSSGISGLIVVLRIAMCVGHGKAILRKHGEVRR